MPDFQRTMLNPIEITGIGVHSGCEIYLKISPASENHGIIFKRIDLSVNNVIPAHFENVVDTRFCTVIANEHGASVATIEHLMSALWGCGIDNAMIEVNAPEVPVMDGSSCIFMDLIQKTGTRQQSAYRKVVKIIKPIKLVVDDKKIEILPCENFAVDFTIQFSDKVIGEQSYTFNETNTSFDQDISKARTFGFVKDLELLNKSGLAKGANLSNAIGVTEEGILNEEGLRYSDEFVRHKVLDCIGDLYLAGMRIKGYVKAFKAGHALNNQLLKKLFSNKEAYTLIDMRESLVAV